MKNNTLTFGQLYEKLKTMGFRQRTVEVDNKRAKVFEHKTINNAMIVLPERSNDDKVEPFYMNGVTAGLKAHDLLPDCSVLTTS